MSASLHLDPEPCSMRCLPRLLGLLPLLLAFHCFAQASLPAAPAAAPPAVQDDGPYVFRVDNHRLEALWVCAGKPVREVLRERAVATVAPRCGYPHPLRIPRTLDADAPALAPGARIIALSDIHGQYGVMQRLLRANGVIDAQDRWAAGHDHLVIAGDVFDRGPQVTEAFWLLFSLQQQARAAGGAVHFLLGNHETMALYDDLRYLNPKYKTIADLLDKAYPALYGADTVLGAWLRTRPVMLKLGDTLFLHGGIAPENIDLVRDLAATNAAYDHSLGTPKAQVKADPALNRLYNGKTSPIWYRGYFNGALTTEQVKALVAQLGVTRIVVGHTTIGEVASFHDGKVIAIDSGIKRGKAGQLLFIEGDQLSRGLMDGCRQPLPALTAVADDPE
ncbi:metallophosphoesterase [Thermomonas sp.]|uniref:metallophosphoesterase n=1 Tax=Thermomonas sp. TaxID=1971895 RepID=UPI00261E89C9|nr:metallophosphoesterase [Thermomonas sp.]